MSAHASQAFSIASCTDSEDSPRPDPLGELTCSENPSCGRRTGGDKGREGKGYRRKRGKREERGKKGKGKLRTHRSFQKSTPMSIDWDFRGVLVQFWFNALPVQIINDSY